MALTANASQGMERYRYTQEDEVLWLPGDPGVTYTNGDIVKFGSTAGAVGVMERCTGGSTANAFGVVAKTVVCPAAATAFPVPLGANGFFDDDSAQAKTLVPVVSFAPAGHKVFRCTFANQIDDTVISYSAASTYIAATTGHAADDRPNGGLLYVYEGPGAGEVNVVDDYDHTGGAVELLVQTHRAFNATLTSSSKYIVLAGEAATGAGIGIGGRLDDKDQNEMDVADGYNDGDYVVYGSWMEMGQFLKTLTLPVVRVTALYI